MNTNIQIRGVPRTVRDSVRRRAASLGRSMSEYLLDLIKRDLQVPTLEEFERRLAGRPAAALSRPAAREIEAVRRDRDRALERRRTTS